MNDCSSDQHINTMIVEIICCQWRHRNMELVSLQIGCIPVSYFSEYCVVRMGLFIVMTFDSKSWMKSESQWAILRNQWKHSLLIIGETYCIWWTINNIFYHEMSKLPVNAVQYLVDYCHSYNNKYKGALKYL